VKFSSITATLRAALLVGLLAGLSSGCYLLQSAQGQLSLMSKRQPIARVIARPDTPAPLRAQLQAVAEIRDFATRTLKLPDNGSYRSYADVKRRYVVWNVVSAPEFSVAPREWCYPIVGCVAYRGYFVEARAEKFAAEQRASGSDVAVGGVAAYSTLGHFDDPILNTMLGWNDVELAAIIFHELTHQLLYVANDASFNEALATTVEEEGVKRWLIAQGREQDLKDHLVEEQRYLAVVNLLNATRAHLRILYAKPLPAAAMREAKAAEFAALRAEFGRLQTQFGGHAPFESWFAEDINNAHLASVATYFSCVPGFERELKALNGDLPAFYRRVKELSKMDPKARDAQVCGDGLDR
jgi:predicted aminopeptidase